MSEGRSDTPSISLVLSGSHVTARIRRRTWRAGADDDRSNTNTCESIAPGLVIAAMCCASADHAMAPLYKRGELVQGSGIACPSGVINASVARVGAPSLGGAEATYAMALR